MISPKAESWIPHGHTYTIPVQTPAHTGTSSPLLPPKLSVSERCATIIGHVGKKRQSSATGLATGPWKLLLQSGASRGTGCVAQAHGKQSRAFSDSRVKGFTLFSSCLSSGLSVNQAIPGDWRDGQSVKHLQLKPEDLSSNQKHPRKRTGMKLGRRLDNRVVVTPAWRYLGYRGRGHQVLAG